MRLCTDLVKKRVGAKYIRNAKKMRILSTGKYLVHVVQYIHKMHWCLTVLREPFKYYFADFVRKGGNPPPLYGQNFRQKKVTDLGGTPPQWATMWK